MAYKNYWPKIILHVVSNTCGYMLDSMYAPPAGARSVQRGYKVFPLCRWGDFITKEANCSLLCFSATRWWGQQGVSSIPAIVIWSPALLHSKTKTPFKSIQNVQQRPYFVTFLALTATILNAILWISKQSGSHRTVNGVRAHPSPRSSPAVIAQLQCYSYNRRKVNQWFRFL